MKYIPAILLSALFLASCGNDEIGSENKNKVTYKNCLCSDTTLGKDSICPNIPHGVLLTFNTVGYDSRMAPDIQKDFDLFSWQSFVALNWPADNNGNYKPVPLGSDNTSLRVWEHYPWADTVFIGPHANNKLQLKMMPADVKATKQLVQFSKFSQDVMINGVFFESDGSTLIDKNLNYVLFEERLNNDEWDYINSNNLRTQEGQLNFIAQNNNTQQVSLPGGYYENGQWGKPGSGKVGAIEIKASWRLLSTAWGDDLSRYYHQEALITIPAEYSWNGQQLQFTATVGLVGMHIVHMLPNFQKEIWSTFEHVDNVPDSGQVDNNKVYSFYNPAYKGPLYQKPGTVKGKKAMWNPVPPYALDYGVDTTGGSFAQIFGTQAPRYFSIYISTDSINQVWQGLLKGTVWSNYKLVGTQWFSQETFGSEIPNAPVYLANSTMETYIQPTASCITCHNFAVVAGTPKDSVNSLHYKSSFSFLFHHASTAGLDEQEKKSSSK